MSKYALYGVFAAVVAIILATLLVARYAFNEISLDAIISAQLNTPTLWLLDAMPFVFAFWGRYVRSAIAHEASAMVIDQTSALEQQAMRDATHDVLTDLPNRALFRDRLQQALAVAQRDKTQLAVLLMDLNQFKEVNNTLGHYMGDRLLKQIAVRLRSVIYEPATVARIGGDEFGIVLPAINTHEDARQEAYKILKSLEAPFELEGLMLGVQASIGITLFPEHGGDADTLQQRADVSMYVAKKNNSGFVIYAPSLDRHSPLRLTLMGELRQAIAANELVLHYQPKADINSRGILGVEALVRWQHPRHGLIAPDEFIPLAERTGLIKPLTVWVLSHALWQCSAWRRSGMDLSIAVNLSAQTLHDFDLPDTISGMLAAHDVPPERLILEITESAIMVDEARALEILTRLHNMGMSISIDDFGTGHSSLAHLSKMPVSEIKIDKSFVLNMTENNNDAKIVRATVDLGHNLGLKVIAEGVENQLILAQLHARGCDAVQGFYITRPLCALDFNAWISGSVWKVARP